MTNKEIKKLCRSFGADLVGVASVERFVNAPKGYHPTDVMPTAKSVISLGMVLPKDILIGKSNRIDKKNKSYKFQF